MLCVRCTKRHPHTQLRRHYILLLFGRQLNVDVSVIYKKKAELGHVGIGFFFNS